MHWKIFKLTQTLGKSTEYVLNVVTVALIKIRDYLKMEKTYIKT